MQVDAGSVAVLLPLLFVIKRLFYNRRMPDLAGSSEISSPSINFKRSAPFLDPIMLFQDMPMNRQAIKKLTALIYSTKAMQLSVLTVLSNRLPSWGQLCTQETLCHIELLI